MGGIKNKLSYLNKALFCFLAPVALLLLANKAIDIATTTIHPMVALIPIPGVPDINGKILSLPELLAQGDMKIGKKVAKKCVSCHTFNQGGEIKTGPNLWNILNRQKASATGFEYSDVLKEKGGKWTEEDLNQWLTSPQKYAKGSKMVLTLRKAKDRANIIVYLRSLVPSGDKPMAKSLEEEN